MVRLAQTMLLSCTNTSTVLKWTEMRTHMTETCIHLSLVTYEYHQVHPKWFSSYVWCEPCTYLASWLAPSPNGPKQVSSLTSSTRSTIRCIQNDFKATFGANHAPILHYTISKWIETRFHMTNVTEEIHRVCSKQFLSLWYVRRKPCTYLASRLALSPNRPKRASTWASSPRTAIGCIQDDFQVYGTIRHKPCSYLSSRLALSPNRPKRASTWASSPRSTIGCVQNDFWAYGMFGANHAPILPWH
jgi:hypothetical protein